LESWQDGARAITRTTTRYAKSTTQIFHERRNGAPGAIRTPDPQIRSLVLYPAELRVRIAEPGFVSGCEAIH
jgi:hypothetical protein